jgi:hypothetical protein
MDLKGDIKKAQAVDELIIARLASAFTLLALAPYDDWGHEGSPAAMAVHVVQSHRERGSLGMLTDIIAPDVYKEKP